MTIKETDKRLDDLAPGKHRVITMEYRTYYTGEKEKKWEIYVGIGSGLRANAASLEEAEKIIEKEIKNEDIKIKD